MRAYPEPVALVAFRVALAVFVVALAADLLSKWWAVDHLDGVVYNPKPSDAAYRVAMSVLAIVVAAALTKLAAVRGLGRQWGVWVGVALLVAGITANGVSLLFWPQGVPDFIDAGGGWIWNVADFEIAIGLAGGIASVAVAAVLVFARERFGRESETGRLTEP
jgi:lipoprotein signal peptidase